MCVLSSHLKFILPPTIFHIFATTFPIIATNVALADAVNLGVVEGVLGKFQCISSKLGPF